MPHQSTCLHYHWTNTPFGFDNHEFGILQLDEIHPIDSQFILAMTTM